MLSKSSHFFGFTDLLWRDPSGNLTVWTMDNGVPFSIQPFQGIPYSYDLISGRADFDANGASDLFWRGLNDGQTVMWEMAKPYPGAVLLAGQTYAGVPPAYGVTAAGGDYNGDGRSDLLWKGSIDGQLTMWQMSGTVIAASTSYGQVPLNYAVVDGVSDFSGDGRSDILFRGMDDGQTTLWLMNGDQIAQRVNFGAIPTSFSILDTHGDFNGDGTNDILWLDHASGNVVEWVMRGGAPLLTSILGQIPTNFEFANAKGDYNGDGINDILWRDKQTGNLTEWFMVNGQLFATRQSGAVPAGYVLEDSTDSLNGDRYSDFLFVNPATGESQLLPWTQYGLNPFDRPPVIEPTMAAGSRVINDNGLGIQIYADAQQVYYGTGSNDRLTFVAAGMGYPTLHGGEGQDSFYLRSFGATIDDFVSGVDRIEINASNTTSITFVHSLGFMAVPYTFDSGTAPVFAPLGQLYYNTGTGDLTYGSNLVAHLTGAPSLLAADVLRFTAL